jgi:hypothetical protein
MSSTVTTSAAPLIKPLRDLNIGGNVFFTYSLLEKKSKSQKSKIGAGINSRPNLNPIK